MEFHVTRKKLLSSHENWPESFNVMKEWQEWQEWQERFRGVKS
jgi:hypothetical protein